MQNVTEKLMVFNFNIELLNNIVLYITRCKQNFFNINNAIKLNSKGIWMLAIVYKIAM